MRPVGRTKRITHIQISQVSQLFAEFLAVLGLFLTAETGILQQNHIAFLHGFHSLCGSFAGHIIVGHKHHFPAKLLG